MQVPPQNPTSMPPVQPVPVIPLTIQPRTAKKKSLFTRPSDQQIRACKILVVDDELSVAIAIGNHLSRYGFGNSVTITDSSKALNGIQSYQPDLVLLDLKMPTHGMTILEAIRHDKSLHHIPVIIFTSELSTEARLKALNAAADDFLTKPINPTELIARIRNTLSNKLMRDHITRYSQELESDVLRDDLTKMANRRAFDYELNRRLIDWRRMRSPLSLLMIDIDYFKRVNDVHGHIAGDRILQQVAEQIQNSVREMDLVARYGGEEFAVVMPNTNSAEAIATAERIRNSVARLVTRVSDEAIQVTVSIGIGRSMNGDDAKLLTLRTDDALYESKRAGRNRACFHDGGKLNIVDAEGERVTSEHQPAEESTLIDDIEATVKESKVLLIDDEPSTLLMVKKLLKKNDFLEVSVLDDATKAFDLIAETLPDLVMLDIYMPEVSGLQILERLRQDHRTRRTPVIILTSSVDSNIKVEALGLGANDVLHKPIHESEMVARVRNTLMAKAHLDALASYSTRLEQDVRLRTAELMASRREAIQCLARAAESRDDATGHHVLRVGRYAAIIAEELGFAPEKVIAMEHAAQLHDVGKIVMPDDILKKPGKLTDAEFEEMKKHCNFGSNIIRDASHKETTENEPEPQHGQLGVHFLDDCNSRIMKMAAVVADSHHEKWDGSGYPNGKEGKDIPIEGRITAVADVFDALSNKRCYKDAFSIDECFRIIEEGGGTHFDPDITEAFLRRRFDIIDVFESFKFKTVESNPNVAEGSVSDS